MNHLPAAVTGHKPGDFRNTTLDTYFQSPPQRRLTICNEYKPCMPADKSLRVVTARQAGISEVPNGY